MSEVQLLRDYGVTVMVVLVCCFAGGLVNVVYRRLTGHNIWRAPVEEEMFLSLRIDTDLEDDDDDWQ